MSVKLTFNDNSVGEDGFRVYRASAPMDVNALPAPLVTLLPDVIEYIDTSVSPNTLYYYIVSTFKGALEKLSNEIQVLTTGATVSTGLNPDFLGSNLTLDPDNTTLHSDGTGPGWRKSRSQVSHAGGKWVFEVTILDDNTAVNIGIIEPTATVNGFIGSTINGYSYFPSGGKAHNGNFPMGGSASLPTGQTVLIAIDLDNGLFNILRDVDNNVLFNLWTDILPGGFSSAGYFASIALDTTKVASIASNLGDTPFHHTIPQGYLPWNGSTPVILTTLDPGFINVNLVLSNGNLTVSNTTGTNANLVRSTNSVSAGKIYFEFKVLDTAALNSFAENANYTVGFGDTTVPDSVRPGGTGLASGSHGYTNGFRFFNSVNFSLGGKTITDVWNGVSLDADSGDAIISLNGVVGSVAQMIISAPIPSMGLAEYFILADPHNATTQLEFNFGNQPFTLPSINNGIYTTIDGAVLSNIEILNAAIKSNTLALYNDGLVAVGLSGQDSIPLLTPVVSGKWYLEVDFNAIGVSPGISIGVIDTGFVYQLSGSFSPFINITLNSFIRASYEGWFGKTYANGTLIENFEPLTPGDTTSYCGVALDMDNRTLTLTIVKSGLPFTSVPIPISGGVNVNFALTVNNFEQVTLNLGNSPFKQPIPIGHSAWKNIDNPITMTNTILDTTLGVNLTFSANNLDAAWSTGAQFGASVGTQARKNGKFHFEVTIINYTSTSDQIRVGLRSSSGGVAVGTELLGLDVQEIGYRPTGNIGQNTVVQDGTATFTGNFTNEAPVIGDVIGVIFDGIAKTLEIIGKTGSSLGTITITGPGQLTNFPMYPAFSLANGTLRFNFGASAFIHTYPVDSKAWNVD